LPDLTSKKPNILLIMSDEHVRYGFGLTDTDPEVVKRGRELYYGLVDWFDDEVGKPKPSVARSTRRDTNEQTRRDSRHIRSETCVIH